MVGLVIKAFCWYTTRLLQSDVVNISVCVNFVSNLVNFALNMKYEY